MTKLTYVDALTFAIENLDNAEVVEKLTALREQQIKRNTKSDKVTPKEQAKIDADAVLMENVREILRNASEPLTVTAIKEGSEDLAEIKVQKLSAIVRKMLMNGEVVRTEVKRKAVFALA
jgi:hypothetical protein